MRVRKPGPTAPERLLVRHADAGNRDEWTGPDDWRPLSPLGWEQAAELPARVAGTPVMRILSSPSLRCRQTVVPLARHLGLDVEPCHQLHVGADGAQLLRFLQDPETEGAVICTHRETLERFFAELEAVGMTVPRTGGTMPKASAWLLHGPLDRSLSAWLQLLPLRPSGSAATVG